MPGLLNRAHALHRLKFTLLQADTDLLEAFLGLVYLLLGLVLIGNGPRTFALPAFAPLAETGLPPWGLGLVMCGIGGLTLGAVGNGWRSARAGGQFVVCTIALFLFTMFIQGSPWGFGWVIFAIVAAGSFFNVVRLAHTHRR